MPEIPKIVSVDDHVIEPPGVWQDRLPAVVPGGRAPARPPQGQEHEVRRRRVLLRGRGRTRRRHLVRLVADRGPPVPAHAPVGRGRLPARRDHGQPDHHGRHAQGLLGPEGALGRHGREPRGRVARVPELPPLLRPDLRGAQGQDARRPVREGLQRLDVRRVVRRHQRPAHPADHRAALGLRSSRPTRSAATRHAAATR